MFAEFGRGLGVPLLLLVMLAMMMVPLPALALDILFTFNIALSVAILLTAVYVGRPLDFGVFPTILLVVTLLRLALNIASTRVVLLNGHTGTAAAGKVIEAFGDFVVGGNYAVGLVIFGILVIINFVVVTKGAGRVSEVTARFTLDAMPGKQMAIDADLNAGIIDQEGAKRRRQEVGEEADFYGSMDGASKFVRGDAIAGILILFINIIGGLIIGTAQHGLALSAAVRNYTLLTIGDGLVAQIPSLLLSTAVAIIVTRVSRSQDMSKQVFVQLFNDPRTMVVTCGVMTVLGLIPGMPNFAFLSLAAVCAFAAYRMSKKPVETEP
ncbi:MAG: FHIPEP family type III secretion protein, partial [Woeseiaceae bacterium]